MHHHMQGHMCVCERSENMMLHILNFVLTHQQMLVFAFWHSAIEKAHGVLHLACTFGLLLLQRLSTQCQ